MSSVTCSSGSSNGGGGSGGSTIVNVFGVIIMTIYIQCSRGSFDECTVSTRQLTVYSYTSNQSS